MNKSELVKKVAIDTHYGVGMVSDVVESVIENITDVMKNGGKVVLPGFGKFETVIRQPRTARDICAGESIRIPKHIVPTFKASKTLKQQVKNPISI